MVGATDHETAVTAWTNGSNMLVVEGEGVVDWAPWGPVAGGIDELVKDKNVEGLDGIMATLPALTTVNGLTLGDLTAATESWGKTKVEDVGLDEETGEAIRIIPAPADKGFFIINPKSDVPSELIEPPHTTVR